MIGKIFSRAYRKYHLDILPRINHLRGSHRLLMVLRKLSELGLEKIDEEPQSIFEKGDWDNLLILDACRHDLYEEVRGDADYRISLGSETPQFIKKTFSEGDFSDIVYITGNPFFSKEHFKELTGRDVEEVFKAVYHVYQSDWDGEKGTVTPEPLIRDWKSARKLFPESRIIVHFMQPHFPFINSNLTKGGIRPDLDHGKEREDIWKKAERGVCSREEVWNYYRANLKYVLEKLEEGGAAEIEGKTVITSDHGNLVGENGVFGHPARSSTKFLRKIPWESYD